MLHSSDTLRRRADVGRADDALIEVQYIGAGVEGYGLTIGQCTEPIERHGRPPDGGKLPDYAPRVTLVYGRSGAVAHRRHAARRS